MIWTKKDFCSRIIAPKNIGKNVGPKQMLANKFCCPEQLLSKKSLHKKSWSKNFGLKELKSKNILVKTNFGAENIFVNKSLLY